MLETRSVTQFLQTLLWVSEEQLESAVFKAMTNVYTPKRDLKASMLSLRLQELTLASVR